MATSTLGSGTLVLAGTTSGTTTVTATAVAGTTTLTLPAATDTLVGKATTDTLTNKTLTGAAMNGTVGATTPSTGAFTTLSTSGNVGVGVTPSAWGTPTFQVSRTSVYGSGSFTAFASNWFSDTGDKYIASDYATQYYQLNGQHVWRTAASGTAGNPITFIQAMTLDASGNLGIGSTSPIAKLDISGISTSQNGLRLTATSGGQALAAFTADTSTGEIRIGGTVAAAGAYFPVFYANGSPAARIDTSGRFLLGSTTSLAPAGTIIPLGYRGREGTGGTEVNNFNIAWNGSGANLWIDTTNTGVITVVSDYRVKKNIETQLLPAIERVMLLRPVKYEIADYGGLFKADGVKREGFIAHEVQDVIPSGAEGKKDEEGRIQSLKADAILSVVVKAIQEQQALITQLQADVSALKGA